MPLARERHSLLLPALGIVAAITLLRIAVLIATPLQLYPDEAQYWYWAQVPDWGYFSKPPLVAWIIWLTTRMSDAEWAIRFASPLIHGATALLILLIGELVFDARVGFWSALAYLTLPGVSYSSGLISTDVPLLLCWAAALYSFLRAMDEDNLRWPMICGIAIGFGLLAKYAMLYFVLGAVVATVTSASARRLLLSFRGALILVLAAVIVSPNVMWNAVHGWPTFAHTEANANWSRPKYDLRSSLSFVAGQFGIFGPLMMAGWLGGVFGLWSSPERDRAAGILMCMSLPVLLLVIAQAFISDANANWGAPAYVTAVPLATATLLRWWRSGLLWLSLLLATVVMMALWTGQLSPALADRIGFGNALKRQEGWRELGGLVVDQSHAAPYSAIAAGNRSVLAELLYYARARTKPLRAWDRNPVPHDHFQMTIPLLAGSHRVLLIASPDESSAIQSSFDSPRLLRIVSLPLGRYHERVLGLYDTQFYKGSYSAY